MNQDFRIYLDRVVSTPPEKRGTNITISHPKTPAIRWHEDMRGCRSIDDAQIFLPASKCPKKHGHKGIDGTGSDIK